jgi:hypothetical protein
MENLTKCGQWYFRTGEVTLKEYYKLSSTDRSKHIEFLLTLDKSQRSSNDLAILELEKVKEDISNFFSL